MKTKIDEKIAPKVSLPLSARRRDCVSGVTFGKLRERTVLMGVMGNATRIGVKTGRT